MAGKLIRDKVPDVIRAGGRAPIVRPAWANEIEDLLNAKLMEEVGELAAALREKARENTIKEFADVLAWLTTIANIANIDGNVSMISSLVSSLYLPSIARYMVLRMGFSRVMIENPW